MKKLVTLFGIILLFTSAGVRASDAAFPHRAQFKNVPIMSPESLRKDLDKVVVVDVRSRYEFETLHIKGALHIVLSKEKLPAAAKECARNRPCRSCFYATATAARSRMRPLISP